MSNAPAVTKPRGSRMGSLVGRRPPLSLGVTFGSRPGVGGSNPVNTWFLEFLLFTAAGLTAALSMTFQQYPPRPQLRERLLHVRPRVRRRGADVAVPHAEAMQEPLRPRLDVDVVAPPRKRGHAEVERGHGKVFKVDTP